MTRLRLLAPLALLAAIAAGCGGGSGATQISAPTIAPAKTYTLGGFQPAGPVAPNKPVTVSFTILQPDGQPLTQFKRGPGPHTGVHLIMVRTDLSTIIHRHPPIKPGGHLKQQVEFPEPGAYKVVIDVYPKLTGLLRNFQLFTTVHVAGKATAKPLPPFSPTVKIGGFTVTMHGMPKLKAIQAAFLTITVKDRNGKNAVFQPWYGALAHAIFFRQGSLDYFHTHVCAPGATGCASVFGGATVSGTSVTPGRLHVGVLVPVPGTWRLFLQFQVDGHILTAPFTLKVGA